MRFAYEDLSDGQFENLIVFLCQRLLGISVQGFAKGPDGGRDAKFVGTAELHPSKAAPWVGTTIIQAKHTNGYNRNFSESDFFSTTAANTVLGKEIPRIKKLRESKQLDHYMLFANRRLAGNAESEIHAYIAVQCDIPESSIHLCGLEHLEVLLKTFPDVPEKVNLDPVDSPLIVSPDDLAEVVQALARQRSGVSDVLDDPPTTRVTYEQKNALNNMTGEYAKAQRRRYLKETAQIRAFLAAPENLELLRMYESVVDEFQLKIIAKRKDYQTFDAVMEYLGTCCSTVILYCVSTRTSDLHVRCCSTCIGTVTSGRWMMLRPSKHSHPDRTVINVSLLLLARLKARRVDEYDTLRKYAKKAVIGGDVLFQPALNFLFLMGLIDYRPKTDAVEYVGPNEAV